MFLVCVPLLCVMYRHITPPPPPAKQEVYMLTSGVHALATQILAPSTRKILQAEGVRNLTPLAFYEWCHEKRGFGKVHIFKDVG